MVKPEFAKRLNHITIFLPFKYRGGSLRVTKNIARMIARGSELADEKCTVRVAVLPETYDLEEEFRELREIGVEVREVSWRFADAGEIDTINLLQGRNVVIENNDTIAINNEYLVPEDGINNFMDSDLWLIVSDRLSRPLAPIRPYGIFATDYIQRYVPNIFIPPIPGEVDLPYIQAVRQADFVLCTTPQTMSDVISYAGVPANRVHLAPMDFDPTFARGHKRDQKFKKSKGYFIWPTNTSQHKNHLRALRAIDRYFSEMDGILEVVVTGPNTVWMSPQDPWQPKYGDDPYIKEIRSIISSSGALMDRVSFVGELNDEAYAKMVAAARFMWHPTLMDNGTFAVTEAAYLGCPSLSSNYPQMRYIGQQFGFPMKYFDAHSTREMATALKQMESEATQIASSLPEPSHLLKYSWENLSSEYWRLLKKVR